MNPLTGFEPFKLFKPTKQSTMEVIHAFNKSTRCQHQL